MIMIIIINNKWAQFTQHLIRNAVILANGK